MCIPTFQDVQVTAAVCEAPELFMILELETHWLVIIKIGQTPDLFLGQTSQFTGPPTRAGNEPSQSLNFQFHGEIEATTQRSQGTSWLT